MKGSLGRALLFVVCILLAILSLLGLVAVEKTQEYESRGIPDALREPIQHGGAEMGINVSLEQYGDAGLDEVLKDIAGTEIHYVKQSFYFCPDFDWNVSDQLVDAIGEQDLELIPLLDGCPTSGFAPPENPADYAAWVGEFAERYGDRVDFYIIWDEPNLRSHWGNQNVNPSEYGALLTASAEAIRRTDSSAAVILAPLAPTIETGPRNLSDSQFLQDLYDAGLGDSFDIAAAKPYGFDSDPHDRQVDTELLNFSHVILMREVMETNDDGTKAIWAGNWGWNSLPAGWQGKPSIWGQVDEETQAGWTVDGFTRAKREWPWMGIMFLENYQPLAEADDPRWGFSIAGRPIQEAIMTDLPSEEISYPGFTLAEEEGASQSYDGDWRFAPEFGADVGASGDSVSLRFWGTDAGLHVRRADFNARFYVTVDDQSANLLPDDGVGAALVLNPAIQGEDYLSVEPVVSNLDPGEHIMRVEAFRGSDQWALKGFMVGYQPPSGKYAAWRIGLIILAGAFLAAAFAIGRRIDWSEAQQKAAKEAAGFSRRQQLALATVSALVVTVSGWLTWGEQAAGLYRRMGDGGQLALTAAMASIFYIAPSFILYLVSAAVLFLLIFLRPAWGIALVSFSLPFYVKSKPLLGYRFSPVETFLILTLAAVTASFILSKLSGKTTELISKTRKWTQADFAVLVFTIAATLSLAFTERLDVATNELRVVIIEPAIFYLLLRLVRIKEDEMWSILDAFIAGGLVMAVIGLFQYATGQNLITSEGGLMRLRSVYGSPNNVALYLGRMIPLLVAMALMGTGRRRLLYAAALVPIGVAVLLTYSKGSLLLGLPASLLVVLILWRRQVGGRLLPWIAGVVALGAAALYSALQIPQIAGRLNPGGETGLFRLNLWQSSLNMIRDHPLFGVGLDNFLYAYRGRYILDGAWREPNLNHPHNILLDFATRLGLVGLAAGIWMIVAFFRIVLQLQSTVRPIWRPVTVGLLGFIIYMLFHGLVDHSFFLVDLAFVFYFMLGLAIWLQNNQIQSTENATN